MYGTKYLLSPERNPLLIPKERWQPPQNEGWGMAPEKKFSLRVMRNYNELGRGTANKSNQMKSIIR